MQRLRPPRQFQQQLDQNFSFKLYGDENRTNLRLFAGLWVRLFSALDSALAPQLALKPVEWGKDNTRQFGVFSKEDTGDRH